MLDSARLAQRLGDVGVAERVAGALRDPILVAGHEVFATCGMGIALSRSGSDTADTLLRNADLAMYRAKVNGKSRYELFDPAMNCMAMERLELEADLRRALDNQSELCVYYQPIGSLETTCVTDMEALVRWAHPERGLVSPSQFIPIAEETGLIVPLDQGYYFMRPMAADHVDHLLADHDTATEPPAA